jgi:diketogulonate reductase-like aldo/keto reductase
LRDENTRGIARAIAAEILKLELTLNDLVNQAYALTPAEIALMWQTAPPRMPIPEATTPPSEAL